MTNHGLSIVYFQFRVPIISSFCTKITTLLYYHSHIMNPKGREGKLFLAVTLRSGPRGNDP